MYTRILSYNRHYGLTRRLRFAKQKEVQCAMHRMLHSVLLSSSCLAQIICTEPAKCIIRFIYSFVIIILCGSAPLYLLRRPHHKRAVLLIIKQFFRRKATKPKRPRFRYILVYTCWQLMCNNYYGSLPHVCVFVRLHYLRTMQREMSVKYICLYEMVRFCLTCTET